MFANEISFPNGQVAPDMRLEALGFSRSGDRKGGLEQARLVTVPSGAHLIRLHMGSSPFGKWWITPYEYRQVSARMGLDGSGLFAGSDSGASAMHAVLALFPEWYGHRSDQICRFSHIRLEQPFRALYGPGNDAGVRMADGVAARQIFMPSLSYYRANYLVITESEMVFGGALDRAVAKAPGAKLPFE